MDPKEQGKAERREADKQSERPIAPPIEREHETYAGVFEEEDEREDGAKRS